MVDLRPYGGGFAACLWWICGIEIQPNALTNALHRWYGSRYVWVGGHWDHPPHYGAVWHPGLHANRRGAYIWIDGH
jgi:hypothetical protein